MRGGPSVHARARRLESARGGDDLRAEAEWLAAGLGLPAEELLAEAEALAARHPGRTGRTLAAAVAEEAGLDPDAVWVEAERVLAGWGRR